jgi:uncharacterized membrane protein
MLSRYFLAEKGATGAALWMLLMAGVAGALLVVVGVPLALRKVPPNKWYGLRTRRTLSDERAWYDVNRIAAQGMVIVGVVLTVASLVLFLLAEELSEMTRLTVLAVVVLVAVAGLGAYILKALDRM